MTVVPFKKTTLPVGFCSALTRGARAAKFEVRTRVAGSEFRGDNVLFSEKVSVQAESPGSEFPNRGFWTGS
jgi:hypothetical protein